MPVAEPEPPATDWDLLAHRFAAALSGAQKARLAEELSVPVEALDELPLVGCNLEERGYPCYTFPEEDAHQRVVGILRRWPRGKAPTGKGKMLMAGGARGLSIPYRWAQNGGPKNVVEGPTCTLAASYAGLSVVGRPSNCAGADQLAELYRHVRPEVDIIIWGEHDLKPDGNWPGRWGAEVVARALSEKLGRPVRIAFPPAGAKDVRDYLTAGSWGDTDWPVRGRALLDHAMATATVVDTEAEDRPLFAGVATGPATPPPPDPDVPPGPPDPPDGGGAPPPDPPQPIIDPDDPHRLADEFLDRESPGDDPRRLRYWREQFVRWRGGAYRTVPEADIRAEVTEFVRGRFLEEAQYQAQIDAIEIENDEDEHGGPPTVQQVKNSLVSDVLNALKGRCLLPADVSPPAWLFGTDRPDPAEMLSATNGLIDLAALAENRPDAAQRPTPAFFTFTAVPYDFDPAAPPPAAWLRFLADLWPDDPETIACLQEWFGYLLTADTRQQKILFLLGPKRAGKGTIAGVLRELVGAGNVAGPTLNSLATNFGLQSLLNTSVAVIDDARLSNRSNVAVVTERLLTISGEGAITIDRKHREAVTTRLSTRIIILSNELPQLGDASGALAGRIILLRFTCSWYGREDHTLAAQMKAELPGILLWAVEGWRRLRARGRFAQPASAAGLLREMDDLSSPVAQFVRERCVVDPGEQVPVAKLYEAWCRWCVGRGWKSTATEQTFGRDLRAAVPAIEMARPSISGERIRVYIGIRLRTPQDPDPDD